MIFSFILLDLSFHKECISVALVFTFVCACGHTCSSFFECGGLCSLVVGISLLSLIIYFHPYF